MLDCPRTPTLPLRDQYRTAWRCSGCFALPDVWGLCTYKGHGTESHEHERSCERKNCFGKTGYGSRIDYTKDEWLQIQIQRQGIALSEQIRGWVTKDGLTPRICPRAVSMLRPPKRAPISGLRLPCRERWRMQIARLCSAGMLPAAKAEMLVTPVKKRGDEEMCNATRVCDAMSRKSEARTTPRSEVIERARCARARLGGNSAREVEGTREHGLKKVDIMTGENF